MAPGSSFQYEIEKAPKDESGNEVTTIRCHGRLVAGNTGPLSDAVKPLVSHVGRIVVDLISPIPCDSGQRGDTEIVPARRAATMATSASAAQSTKPLVLATFPSTPRGLVA